MRILFINNYYPPYEKGGYEQLCRDVAEQLASKGHAVQVLTSARGTDGASRAGGPVVHRVLQLQPDWESRVPPMVQFLLTRPRADRHNRRQLRALAAEFSSDVIFIWNLECLPRSIAAEAEALPNAAVAYWLAGYSPAEPDEYWQYWAQASSSWKETAKSLLRGTAIRAMQSEQQSFHLKMQHVAVVSDYERRHGIANGTLPAHTQVIYNGVEIDRFLRPVCHEVQGPLQILQAGRVSADKGVHVAIEAVGQLIREHSITNVHLNIAGSGPAEYLASLRRIVERYEIGDAVTFLGRLPRESMPDVMAGCQVLLLPTVLDEPFARVVLEGMAAGLAVVAALTGGTQEVVQHELTGLTFPAGNSHELATQIKRLVADPDLRQRLAANGQQRVVERFSMERMVDTCEGFLQQAYQHQILDSLRQRP